MGVEKISLRTVTLGTLLTLGILPILISFYAQSQFREAALQSKVKTLSRALEVATTGALRDLRSHLMRFNTSFQRRIALADAVDGFQRTGRTGPLNEALEDPFRNGFVGAGLVDLVKLRVYDLDFRLLAESGSGIGDLAPRLPRLLLARAEPRSDVESLKAVGDLWSGPQGPLFSLLAPVGGLRAIGYLEIVADPTFNLAGTSKAIQMPVAVLPVDTPVDVSESLRLGPGQLPLEHVVNDAGGNPVLRVAAYENVEELTTDMRNTQLTTAVLFVAVTLAVLGTALWVFHRFVLGPLGRMTDAIVYSSEAEMTPCVDSRGLKEFHTLALAFNRMTLRLRSSLKELHRLSTEDSLTGLANRRVFDEALEREWSRAYRHCSEVALLLIDIDVFKDYNDTYGHQAGDACLQRVARTFADSVHRPGDVVARYGGEEFAVVLPATSVEGARDIAERMRRQVQGLGVVHEASAVADVVTASVGVAVASPRGGLARHLLESADRALYRAKREGRNRVVVEVPDGNPPSPWGGGTGA